MSTVRSELVAGEPDWPWPLVLVVNRRARRLKLRLDSRKRQLVLTCPPRAGRREALRWADEQRDWAREQVARVPDGEPLVPGTVVPFDGRELTLRWDPKARRTPQIEGDIILCGGPLESLESRVLRWLRGRALQLLSAETADAAEKAGVTVTSVSVGDAGSRWGSCSAAGAIRYNWRLAMAPPGIRQWVVAHEVAHRVHMNHGAAFKRLEAELYGRDVAAARSGLRGIAARLKGIGRGL